MLGVLPSLNLIRFELVLYSKESYEFICLPQLKHMINNNN